MYQRLFDVQVLSRAQFQPHAQGDLTPRKEIVTLRFRNIKLLSFVNIHFVIFVRSFRLVLFRLCIIGNLVVVLLLLICFVAFLCFILCLLGFLFFGLSIRIRRCFAIWGLGFRGVFIAVGVNCLVGWSFFGLVSFRFGVHLYVSCGSFSRIIFLLNSRGSFSSIFLFLGCFVLFVGDGTTCAIDTFSDLSVGRAVLLPQGLLDRCPAGWGAASGSLRFRSCSLGRTGYRGLW
mmetsp:Transcript_29078/g.44735  ORF Transcript_29078/g.44735 Transcript_29078/m.44735 type:complete len:232 (+) Transcript_29078:223-918(+)